MERDLNVSRVLSVAIHLTITQDVIAIAGDTPSMMNNSESQPRSENSIKNINRAVPSPKSPKDDVALFFEVIKLRRKQLGKESEQKKINSSNTSQLETVTDKELSKIASKEIPTDIMDNQKTFIEEESFSSKKTNTTSSDIFVSTPELAEAPTLDNHIEDPMAAPLVGESPFKKKKLKLGGQSAHPTLRCPHFCQAGQSAIGTCCTPEDCYRRGGSSFGPCCGSFLVCCQFSYYCGDTSPERLVTFQSPHYPLTTRGALACDFELQIQEDVCAVRIDFVHVQLFGKLGGVCDVDQILILNSVDGPTSSQCGDLTGYATTVAVRPGQEAPLKMVVIAQNEGYYLWNMRLLQIRCTELYHFKKPSICGSKTPVESATSFYQLLDLWSNSAWYTPSQFTDRVWWREPGPAFNRFYYETTRRALQDGNNFDQAEDRIIGGTDADLHEFPWQVAVILKREFFCGGALINDEYVLSAAHCYLTQDTPVSDLVVFLGDHDLTSSNDTISDVRGVKRIHYHAHFHALLLSNDIAILQLDRPVSFSQRIRPVCLPDPHLAVLGLSGTVAGWGITSYPDGKPNAILQKLQVQVMSNEFCEASLNEDLGPGNLCAVPRSKQGTCFGDSGGPLTILHQNKDTIIGIVSFGITGCAVAPGMPDLYTKVSEYLQWVDISAIEFEN